MPLQGMLSYFCAHSHPSSSCFLPLGFMALCAVLYTPAALHSYFISKKCFSIFLVNGRFYLV